MKKKNKILVLFVIVSAALTTSLIVADAQDRVDNPIGNIRIRTSMVESPDFNVRNVTSGRVTKRWFEISTAYDTTVEWLDELEFVYYIYMETKLPDSRQMLWTHTVSYTDIPRDRHLSQVYIHPNTYERIVDRIVYTGVEVRYRGRPVAWTSEESRVRNNQWWEEARRTFPPTEGRILHREDTPFGLINVDQFPPRKRS